MKRPAAILLRNSPQGGSGASDPTTGRSAPGGHRGRALHAEQAELKTFRYYKELTSLTSRAEGGRGKGPVLGGAMYTRILVPIDLSEVEMTRKGIAVALQIACIEKAQLRIVNVQELTPFAFAEYVPVNLEVLLREDLETMLINVAKQVDYPKELVSTALRFGRIYDEVLEEASAWGADLIVVASHPERSTYLVGSNADNIVQHASCSVLVTRC